MGNERKGSGTALSKFENDMSYSLSLSLSLLHMSYPLLYVYN